ncbi:hypothetical protein CLI64_17545 [Nostoc sp. CENA543]|uniref:hypothetical protein n=2 Tax=unclassified Nostoc TaxID=2593658 RepID=UPI000CA16F71|nr:hypothetical protein [Nostoc sp. CENA543]AUT04403.1 hypothetical protein CLI64_17545 [Nostoc sp. CENA543]MCF4969834.1 hypothetical protein [Nostoc sp. CMAA1605]
MISQDCNAVDFVDELLRKIRIKEKQLKIARASNMNYVAAAIESQLLDLKNQLSDSQDEPELNALMNLLEEF